MGPTAEYISVSRATLFRIAKADSTFPQKIELGQTARGYLKADLDAWLESKKVA